jgi:hypothetical protein
MVVGSTQSVSTVLFTVKELSEPIGEGAGWVPGPVWTLWRMELRFLSPSHGLVPIRTELSRLQDNLDDS